jgi:hypothetical protein
VKEPPAEILRRLRPIPTTVGPPSTRPRDVRGVRPDGASCPVDVVEAAAPVVLLFLSAACLGCRDLWEGLRDFDTGLGGSARLAVVTRDPGEEDRAGIEALATGAPEGVDVVMSSQAFRDYGVAGPPFLVVATGAAVLTESVAWGIEQTLGLAVAALERR